MHFSSDLQLALSSDGFYLSTHHWVKGTESDTFSRLKFLWKMDIAMRLYFEAAAEMLWLNF